MDPILAFVLGFLGAAIPAAIALIWLFKRNQTNRQEFLYLQKQAKCHQEVVTAAPGGLYLWNLTDGTEQASRRLAVLLGLEQGLKATWNDILPCFDAASASLLEKQVHDLRQNGFAFDAVLPLKGSDQFIQINGLRIGNDRGDALADALWMRDITHVTPTEINGAPHPAQQVDPADNADIQDLLNLLPVPVWFRDADLNPSFQNKATDNSRLTVRTRGLALRAREMGKAMTEPHPWTEEPRSPVLEVTEIPMEAWGGTLGFGVERNRQTKQGRERDAALYGVLDRMATAVAVFGPDRRHRHSNAAFTMLWRLDQSWLDRHPTIGQLLDRLREERSLPEYADYREFKERQLSHFDSLKEPLENLLHLPDGRTVHKVTSPHPEGGLVFAFEDVSDKLQLERSVKTLDAVQRQTLDNLYEGIAVFGSDGRLKLHNPAFASLWEMDEESLTSNLHIADFLTTIRPLLGNDGDWPRHKEKALSKILSRQPNWGEIRRQDGKVVDYVNVPLPDEAVLITYLDVTDRARVEKALGERTRALKDADNLKSAFIASVSFEVRNPLNTLINFADVLADQYFGGLNDRQKEYITTIQQTAKGLKSIVDDILDMANVEAGALELEKKPVGVSEILGSSLSVVRTRAKEKQIKLELDCNPNSGTIQADEDRLKQVCINLLINAIRLTPEKGTVMLKALRKGPEVIIYVIDNGRGLDGDEQDKAFDAFRQGSLPIPQTQDTQDVTPPDGSGLGMALAKRFIELHGGTIEIKSTPGRGTKVTCRLPTA